MLEVRSQNASVLLGLQDRRERDKVVLVAEETIHRWAEVVWLTC